MTTKPQSPADQRETARMVSIVLMGAFFLFIGLAVAFHLPGVGRAIVAGVVLLAVVFFAVAMLWPVHPRDLTPVQDHTQSGSWPGMLAVGDIPSVLVTHPTINQTVKLLGRVLELGLAAEPAQAARADGLRCRPMLRTHLER